MKTLDFTGNGKVKVSVDDIVKSERWQENVRAVRRIANQEWPMTESSTPRTDAAQESTKHAQDVDAAAPLHSREEWCGMWFIVNKHREELQRELAEAKRALSDGMPKWIPVEERLPADEQTVLACWVGPSVVNEGMESLVYHAADAPDGPECWHDVFGEERDPPTHWTLKELPK